MLESAQEKIIAVSTLFSLFMAVVYFSARNRHVFEALYVIVVALLSLGLSLLNVYCVINGGCTVWSWVLTLSIAVMAIVTIVLYGRLISRDERIRGGGEEPQVRVINESWNVYDDY